jgi:hypothetical protein
MSIQDYYKYSLLSTLAYGVGIWGQTSVLPGRGDRIPGDIRGQTTIFPFPPRTRPPVNPHPSPPFWPPAPVSPARRGRRAPSE